MLTLNLTADEKALFEKSAEAVRKTNNILHEIKALSGRRIGIKPDGGFPFVRLFFVRGENRSL